MSKQFFVVVLSILALVPVLWAAENDQATSLSGNWQLSWQGRQGTRQATLQLQQDGTQLSGTLKGERDSTPVTGSIQDNKVSLNVKMQGERRTVTLAFKGTVDGDKMNGTFQMQGGGGGRFGRRGGQGQQLDHSWTATRQEAQPSQPDQGSQSDQSDNSK